jgi:hypothetical protein
LFTYRSAGILIAGGRSRPDQGDKQVHAIVTGAARGIGRAIALRIA